MFTLKKRLGKIEAKDIILGGQDGVVNVLGIVLGLFAAQTTNRIIIVAGLAAAFSEAVSMGAVAYTSSMADALRIKHSTRGQIIFGSIIVMFSALIGALIPIISFFYFSLNTALILSVILSGLVLFGFGVLTAKTVGGHWMKSGIQIIIIGLISAFVGFIIGYVLRT